MGLRVSELINLKVENIDINRFTVLIKNAKFVKCRDYQKSWYSWFTP